ncbi:hypothetical protein [Streptomyces sp. NPDC005408]|uniref:hypothetical protein n=1 Tax=Streptomyces sp. NPDC005408 TaxID=3155341 RepID=UPI0033B24F79
MRAWRHHDDPKANEDGPRSRGHAAIVAAEQRPRWSVPLLDALTNLSTTHKA